MFATITVTRSMLCLNDGSRIFYRDYDLYERQADRDTSCSKCHGEIKTGQTYAAGNHYRYCQNCYTDMPEAAARKPIRFDDTKLIAAVGRTYCGVILIDFGDAVIHIDRGGREFRFRDMDEARAFVDAMLLIAADQVPDRLFASAA